MKRFIIFFLMLTFVSVNLFAQQKPHYTQYVLNNYIVNPAFTGIENYTEMKIGYRQQWTGLDGAPTTSYLTIHAPLGKKDERLTPTSMPRSGVNLRGVDYLKESEPAAPHHGIGFQLIQDNIGPIKTTSALATYAYHMALSNNTNLSGGFGVGVSRINLDRNKLNFGTPNPIDPSVSSSLTTLSKSKLDLNAGLLLYSPRYYAGLSVLQILPEDLTFANNTLSTTSGKRVPHIFFTSGYKAFLDDDFTLIPSIMVKYIQPTPVQVEVNAKLQYQNLVWAGASYRFKYGFAGMLGANITPNISLGYSYDYTTTRLNTVTSGTHEIVLGFIFGNKNGDNCPRVF